MLFTCYKTTFKLNNSPHTQMTPHVWWWVLTCWEFFVAYSTADRPGLALWHCPCQGPPPSRQQKEITVMVQHVKKISTAHFMHVLFLSLLPSVALGAGRETARLSENRAVETWNSFDVSSLCFYFWAFGLGCGMKSSSQGENQGNGNLYLINQAPRKERIVQHLLLSPPLFVLNVSSCLSLFFMTCSQLQQGQSSSCWTSGGSSGPSRSSRRCPASSGAAAWEEGSGSIFRLGWSDHSYWTTSHRRGAWHSWCRFSGHCLGRGWRMVGRMWHQSPENSPECWKCRSPQSAVNIWFPVHQVGRGGGRMRSHPPSQRTWFWGCIRQLWQWNGSFQDPTRTLHSGCQSLSRRPAIAGQSSLSRPDAFGSLSIHHQLSSHRRL